MNPICEVVKVQHKCWLLGKREETMGHTQASRVLLFLNDHLGHDMFLGIRILHQKIERLLIYETESDWKYLRGIKKKQVHFFVLYLLSTY